MAAAAATAIPQRRRKETEMRAEKMDLKCEESISNEAEMVSTDLRFRGWTREKESVGLLVSLVSLQNRDIRGIIRQPPRSLT